MDWSLRRRLIPVKGKENFEKVCQKKKKKKVKQNCKVVTRTVGTVAHILVNLPLRRPRQEYPGSHACLACNPSTWNVGDQDFQACLNYMRSYLKKEGRRKGRQAGRQAGQASQSVGQWSISRMKFRKEAESRC